jgi:hypothetical protein
MSTFPASAIALAALSEPSKHSSTGRDPGCRSVLIGMTA